MEGNALNICEFINCCKFFCWGKNVNNWSLFDWHWIELNVDFLKLLKILVQTPSKKIQSITQEKWHKKVSQTHEKWFTF